VGPVEGRGEGACTIVVGFAPEDVVVVITTEHPPEPAVLIFPCASLKTAVAVNVPGIA